MNYIDYAYQMNQRRRDVPDETKPGIVRVNRQRGRVTIDGREVFRGSAVDAEILAGHLDRDGDGCGRPCRWVNP